MYAIYGNMDPINIPPMLAYIPAPWILWDIHCFGSEPQIHCLKLFYRGKRLLQLAEKRQKAVS